MIETQAANPAEVDPMRGLLLLMEGVTSEEVASMPVVHLTSQCESEKPLVFIVPGIEGAASVFRALASRLKARVECLQLTVPQKGNNIREMGQALLPYMLDLHKASENLIF